MLLVRTIVILSLFLLAMLGRPTLGQIESRSSPLTIGSTKDAVPTVVQPGTLVRRIPALNLPINALTKGPDGAPIAPPTPPLTVIDRATDEGQSFGELVAANPEVQKAGVDLALAEFAHRRATLDDRRRTIFWSNLGDTLIFIFVHALVALGVVAATREFAQTMRLREPAQRKADADAAAPPTELEIGLEKLAIKTSLNGLLILLITFAFYVAFLKFVHPVEVL